MATLTSKLYEATDDLGRTLPLPGEVPARRENRTVGMFYFLWCGHHIGSDGRTLDVSKILAADPKAGYHGDSSIWGGHGVYHHWGEPMFGYYYTEDEWVMRRHVEMLTQADIDFLVFDTTNAAIYENNAKMMLRLLSEYRAAGFNTPKAMFYTNTHSGETVQKIYDAIYKPGYCADSWFCLEGKPLIIAVADECSDECREFFTIRASQWPNEPTKQGGWPWMDFVRPQRVLENLRGEPEIINVAVAQHPQIMFGDSAMYGETTNRGRSFHNGKEDIFEGSFKYGFNFGEQWDRAVETDPPFVFVTGWNEWIAGRWQGPPERPLRFVDAADTEYSRDIEPMRGGYFDNYFLQLITNVRRYKGMDDAVVAQTGDTVVYHDFPRGGFVRDCRGYDAHYYNNSGRNEILTATVTDTGDDLVFTAECADDITAPDFHSTWMQLFLDVDGSTLPSFCGYNYVANGYPFSPSLTSLARCTENSRTIEADTYKICQQLDWKCDGKKLTITIPKTELGLAGKESYKIRFKWADSRTYLTRMEDFYTQGDCAPLGRVNFVFQFGK